MQIAILISGVIAAILFILSGISYFSGQRYFKILALSFLGTAIIMFVLMIIRNTREGWEVGSYKGRTDK